MKSLRFYFRRGTMGGGTIRLDRRKPLGEKEPLVHVTLKEESKGGGQDGNQLNEIIYRTSEEV